MEKLLKSLMLFCIFISLIFFGCNDVSDISKNSNKNVNNPNNFVPQDLEITATLLIYKSKSYNLNLSSFITTSGCDAAFYNAGDFSVDAGIITLNSDTIRRYSAPTGQQNPDSMFAYGFQPYEDLLFNGGNYNWNISGTLNYPGFSQTIAAPDHEVTILSPLNGGSFSKSSNLIISWTTSDNPCDTVKILITSDGKVINKYVPDTGSCTITSNELSIFNNNENISISLAAGNYKFIPLLGKYALLAVLSMDQIYCTVII
ncbi:MAG: hypothetical protein V1779_09600 [bacterium]